MKLKAFVLTAGLLAFGVTNAAWSCSLCALPTCKTNLDGQVRNSGDKCTSKSYKFNKNSKCTCPGDKPNATKKCEYFKTPSNDTVASYMYSCEAP